MADVIQRHWSHGPHWQFTDSIIFITWRLAFTLPKELKALFAELNKPSEDNHRDLESQKARNLYLFNKFCEYDLALGTIQQPRLTLTKPLNAAIIKNSLTYFDDVKYELHAYCIMSNHVHLLIRALPRSNGDFHELSKIMQSIKSYTAREIHKTRGTSGQLWDQYYFDRIIRSYENYINVVQYILNNPVKAGLVDHPEQWEHSYFNQRCMVG